MKIIKLYIVIVSCTLISAGGFTSIATDVYKQLNSFKSDTFGLIEKVKADERYYFSPEERDQITSSAQDLYNSFSKIDSLNIRRRIRISNRYTSQEDINSIVYSTFKYAVISDYISYILDGKLALTTVLGEDSFDGRFDKEKVRKLIASLKKQDHRRRSYRGSSSFSLAYNQERALTMSDMVKNIYKLKRNLLTSGATKFQINNIENNLNAFVNNMIQINLKQKEVNWNNGSYGLLYELKELFLKVSSYISLPYKHKITDSVLDSVERELNPGDIALIQRYRKLSNIVFKGNWTHSLLYIGKYSKLESFFKQDAVTQYYSEKCTRAGYTCNSLTSYLNRVYPSHMKMYKQGEFLKDPIVTIEALKPGVILFNRKQSMGWDNLVALRPRLSKLDKALAIENAFASLGKEYDYSFDNYTNSKFVCTELITYSYSTDSRIDKAGLNWEMNYVFKRPVMYAFDILETYFKRKGTDLQQLDLVIYVKGEKGEFGTARRGTEKELLATVDLND